MKDLPPRDPVTWPEKGQILDSLVQQMYKSSLALIWSITHIHVPTATSLLSTTGSDLRWFETAFFSKDITSIIVIPPSEAHKQHKHFHTVIVVNSFHNTTLQGEQLVKTTLTYP